ncbi:hypothetical protein [Gordonia asplenii]|uniref:hypothetical protein n=1 Tax=Gordonia asplenii TaxID=2725283 RepID=UPI001B7D497E|nr:hypothetical protein [Gordonia asplenii]
MNAAKRFRKRPVEIEAMKWDGSRQSMDSLCAWVNSHSDPLDDPCLSYNFIGAADVSDPVLDTVEGDMRVTVGDWVIRGVAGEFYPCKPDIFAATYDEVTDVFDEWATSAAAARWAIDVVVAAGRSDKPELRSTATTIASSVVTPLLLPINLMAAQLGMTPPDLPDIPDEVTE